MPMQEGECKVCHEVKPLMRSGICPACMHKLSTEARKKKKEEKKEQEEELKESPEWERPAVNSLINDQIITNPSIPEEKEEEGIEESEEETEPLNPFMVVLLVIPIFILSSFLLASHYTYKQGEELGSD